MSFLKSLQWGFPCFHCYLYYSLSSFKFITSFCLFITHWFPPISHRQTHTHTWLDTEVIVMLLMTGCICASGPFVPSNRNVKSPTDHSLLTQTPYYQKLYTHLWVYVFVWDCIYGWLLKSSGITSKCCLPRSQINHETQTVMVTQILKKLCIYTAHHHPKHARWVCFGSVKT